MLENAPNRELLAAWKDGNQLAAQVLVRRYMARMTALARSRLSERLARRIDADDIVMSTWRSFFGAINQSRLGVPADDDLWPLLVTMTLRKLSRQAAYHSAERRSLTSESNELNDHWQDIVSRDPTPDNVALVTDELESLMSRLSATDREIFTLRLQGAQQAEIAKALDCSERTVRRSLQSTRETFLQHNRDTDSLTATSAGLNHKPSSDPPGSWDTAIDAKHPTVSFDQILLQELVGQGTFGKVYRALDRTMSSTVAIKFLKRSLWKNRQAVYQLIQEFELVRSLNHRGIVRFHGWGQTPHGSTFLSMEWIKGHNLEQWRQLCDLSTQDAIECGIAICDAVDATHQLGIVHGDLTPTNVLRNSNGRFVLTDFGLSQCTRHSRFTSIGGTPGYLAPEQLSQSFGTISAQTDVFGLGGILYFLVTGQPPVAGKDVPEVIARSLSAAPIPQHAEAIPSGLRPIIRHCLQKESADRPKTVQNVRQALTQIANSHQ